ncbi:hypothetical protein EVAR_66736_1 [Eumeta japonica]|uniref:Uncharacterized protein n=1 Tax=Eumeta variegata TaxID=151549 RepID=A0A4C1SIN8_EUMVA|nr:hypothetical protein EVAR_66736_1 [Eumeta japonica]
MGYGKGRRRTRRAALNLRIVSFAGNTERQSFMSCTVRLQSNNVALAVAIPACGIETTSVSSAGLRRRVSFNVPLYESTRVQSRRACECRLNRRSQTAPPRGRRSSPARPAPGQRGRLRGRAPRLEMKRLRDDMPQL